MLAELRIRDLGVIDDARLEVSAGLNVLTGETGAGKTMVVDALALLLGGRADPGAVRAGRPAALVEGRLQTGDDDQVAALRANLRVRAGREVTIDSRVDPSILGGIVVRLGSQMIDASIRTKLNTLATAMKG